ncbi:glycosyltransferase family A protein [Rhizorhabdus argentea]|uniref:glycosyltransferase family A protein n=1 Tax=Rhizorhabdus argentea TaxID=1387174 RepID=UPI0030EF6E28
MSLTLRSLLAQSDGDFRAILATHDIPDAWSVVASDPRFEIVRAAWTPEPPTATNDDGGRKKWLVKQAVRRLGGGLLMFLDADDWVACDLVATARSAMRREHVGAVVGEGFALDHASRRILPFPIDGVFDGPFHGLCGSSTIGRIVAASDEPCRLDPHLVLGSHHEWIERAEAEGIPLARLATSGVYLVGTGQNHSEVQGPFASWRREVTQAVRHRGHRLTRQFAYRFGQDG